MKRWGSKHMSHATIRSYELVLELAIAGHGDPKDLAQNATYFVGTAANWMRLLIEAGFSKARAEQEVQLVRDLAEGRVIRQMLYVAISEAGHACGPTRESVAGEGDVEGDVEQVIRYRRVEERKAA